MSTPRQNTEYTVIRKTEADWASDSRVYPADFVGSPTDGADQGKHKLFNGIDDYASLTFIEDAAGGGITELTGDVTAGPGSGTQAATIANLAVTTGKIANDAVTFAKMQNAAENTLMGGPQGTGPTPNFALITPGDGLGITAQTLGFTDAAAARAALGLPNVYTAILNQTGTDAPTVTGEVNQLGGTPVWSRFAAGEYALTITGAFPAARTKVYITLNQSSEIGFLGAIRASDDEVHLCGSAYDNPTQPGDDILVNVSFRIEVWPA